MSENNEKEMPVGHAFLYLLVVLLVVAAITPIAILLWKMVWWLS